jgi:sugar phosphate permease
MKDMKDMKDETKEQQYQKVLSYRWVVYGVLITSYFLVFFHRMSVGVVKDELMSGFNMSATSFANLGAMYFYAYAVMQIPSGILADSIGVKKTIVYGSMITGAGSVLFGLAPNILFTFIGRAMVGIGVSVTFICIAKVNTMWFKEKEFGTMTGVTGLVGNLGGVVAQTPLAIMVSVFTYQYTFVAIGLLSVLVAIVALKFVYDKPEDLGLPSIAEIEGRRVNKQAPGNISIMDGLKGVLSNKRTWPPFILLTSYCMTFFAFAGTWGISYFVDGYNMTKIDASNNIVLILISMAIGSLLIGILSDKIKSRKIPLIVFGIIANTVWIVFALVMKGNASRGMISMMMVMYGFFITGFTMSWSLGKESNNPMYSGMAVAVVNTGAFIGGALGPVIFGVFLDRLIGIETGIQLYQYSMVFCIVMNLIGLTTSFLVKETGCRNIFINSEVK